MIWLRKKKQFVMDLDLQDEASAPAVLVHDYLLGRVLA
jgi:hypothetical protein